MKSNDFISAAIVTYNGREKALKACMSLLNHTKRYPLKLYVIDNASSDGTPEALKKLEGVTVLQNTGNIGFGAAHNKILGNDMGKYHFCVNPDITVKSDVLSDMADFLEENPDIAMAMPKILNSDGTEQKLPKEKPTLKRMYLGRLAKFGKVFKNIRNEYTWADREITDVTDINFCTGCFFAMPSKVFKNLSGFDERFFMYLEDADISLRAKEYGRVVIAPQFSVIHEWERQSAKSLKYVLIHMNSGFKFNKKWRKK